MKRALLVALLISPAHAEDAPRAASAAASSTARPLTDEELMALAEAEAVAAAEVVEIEGKAPPGSQSTVDEKTLERAEHDDIHKVLGGVAGVYLRDEDGYGLRPNIGMRGAAAERSAKVALMEDGVLIAPAPYSAPAAYYFPLVTRLSRVDVIKGPAAVLYGPNTVGGAVDLRSAAMADERAAYVDAALGSDLYGKLHARATERGRGWGVQAEYVKLRTDGFKQLDGGGDTGFDKDDASLWLRLGDSPESQLDLRAGYGREGSNETYTGLSDADFTDAPQRRYYGTQLDRMDWDHLRLRADHRHALADNRRVLTTAYRHTFHRVWGKVDAFVGERDLAGILANPEGANAVYYQLLKGEIDSQAPEDELLRGINDRRFVSQGVQSTFSAELTTGALYHQIDAGARMHFDRADRKRHEDAYRMTDRVLVRSERPRANVLDSRAETFALALFAQDRLRWQRLELVLGARAELLSTRFADNLVEPQAFTDGAEQILIPGGGALYHVTDQLQLLAGVHRGFVPAAPALDADLRPELSVNYEAGARWRNDVVAADLIGFFSDYSNLKGTCTFSTGCTAMAEGDQFDGGRVHVSGVEAQVAAEIGVAKGYSVPLAGSYTFTRSRFQTAFDSDFGAWGKVDVGDELPYLPVHQASLSAAFSAPTWELGSALRWHGEVRDVAGQGPIAADERADALLTIDLSAHVQLKPWAELYVTVDNLLDEQVIVSRRPYGARPNAPRLIVGGYKARF